MSKIIFNESPLTSKKAAKEIMARIKCSKYYVEYGSGGSTLYATKYCKKVISVESDPKFQRLIQKKVRNNCKVIYSNIGPTMEFGVPITNDVNTFLNVNGRDYALTPWKFPITPDLVLIDGRYRVLCLLTSFLKNKNNNCVYLFDDFFIRPYYEVVTEFSKILKKVENLCVFKMKKNINEDEIKKIIKLYEQDFR